MRWTSTAASGSVARMNKLSHFIAAALLLMVPACAAAPSDRAAAPSEPEDVGALLRDPKVRAFFVAAPAEKAALLRSHFTRYAARPGLTPDQRAACLGMAASVDEVAFWPHETPEWQAWAMGDGHEMDAVREAFGEDANDVLRTLD